MISAALPELLTGLAAFITAVGGGLAVLAKREASAVRLAHEVLVDSVAHLRGEVAELRRRLADCEHARRRLEQQGRRR